MIYKGAINSNNQVYNIKIIVPTNFPFMAPRVYLDMRVTVAAA
jgi:ubiquitin-protein ligase